MKLSRSIIRAGALAFIAAIVTVGVPFSANAAIKAPAKPSLTSSAASISQGESVTLSWSSSQRASYCTLYPVGKTVMGSSASYMINNLVGTMSFYVTCVNSSGSTTSDSVVVSVVPSNLPVITAFVASPSNVVYGQSTTLSWSTMNVAAGGCSIGALGLSGLPGMGSYMTGPLKATATYTLSCTNSNGDVVSQSVTVVVNDVVVEPPYNI